MNIIKKIGLFFLDIIETGAIALSVFIILYLFVFQPHEVKGNSMYPNFEHGEFLLTDKLTYRFKEPQRGEVIVFKAPVDSRFDYIKRIIALPGETVVVKNGILLINNEKLNESYLPEDFSTRSGKFLKEGQPITLSLSEYLVMGDNRNHSSDSRDWGTVPRENIVGRVWLRYWPLDKFGRIRNEEYQLST
jgi:signal peptidase I